MGKSNRIIRFVENRKKMNYSKALEISQEIQFKLNTLKCNNPDCEKKETRVGRMCSAPIKGAPVSLGEELHFTDMVCCDKFKEELQEKYDELRESVNA